MSRYDDVNKVWDDRAFRQYSKFTDRPVFQATIAAVVGIFTIAVIVLAGWQIGWWFQTQNTNRESHLLRDGYANQQTLRDQITQNISNVFSVSAQIAGASPSERPSLIAQRAAIVGIVCGDAAQIVGDPLQAQQVQFVRANCVAGAISPTSPYYSR